MNEGKMLKRPLNRKNFRVNRVLADGGYDSRYNFNYY